MTQTESFKRYLESAPKAPLVKRYSLKCMCGSFFFGATQEEAYKRWDKRHKCSNKNIKY